MKKLNSFFSILMLLLAVLFAQNSWGQNVFFEGFETGQTHNTTLVGWTQASVSGTDTWSANNSFIDYNRTPRTGSWNGFLKYSNTRWMFKQVTLTGGQQYTLSFYARQDYTTGANIKADYGTTNTNAGMTNPIIALTAVNSGSYQFFQGIFTPATSGTYYIGIRADLNSSPFYISIDDISLDATTPMSGIYTIDPLGSGSTNFTTFTNAINNLHSSGISGAVTFNVAAGSTFNENLPTITATGTAANTITFQKSGAGANPKITPSGTAGTADAGLILQGSDYITFDGIDIDASAVTAVEYGYLIRNATATNGAQYNTIKNCAITLNRGSNSSTSSSSAILQTASSTGGGVVPSNATGANSYNKYYNLTIQSALNGVYLNGNGSYRDLSCEVGTSSASVRSSITNLGPTSNTFTSSRGIYAIQQEGVRIFNNDISSVAADQAASYGIYFTGCYGSANEIYNNKIHTINVKGSTTTSAAAYGLRADLPTSGTHNVRIYNNFISNIYTSFTSTATVSRYAFGMFIGIASAGATQSYDIDNNSISIGSGLTPTYSNTCYELQNSSPSLRFRGNIFANHTNAQTGVAKHFCAIVTAAGIGGTGTALDYNDYYIANSQGTSGHVGRNGSSSTNYNTIADWKTFTTGTLDDNSFSSDPSFTNNNSDLHAFGAGLNAVSGFSTQAWVTTDIDNEDRSTLTPSDVGADAFTPANMAYSSSTTTQTIVTNLDAGATNQQVIGIQVLTTGALNPIDLTKIVVNANGTTSLSDISNAKIWYTGTSSTFATTAQFGSTVASPTTANFEVTGTQTLAQGTNYFWLTYDVASTAVNANVVDAECTSVTVSGSDYAPTVTAPVGTRAIVNKTITSVTGTQASTALVLQGATNQAVLRLDFAVAGPSGGSLLLNSIAATYTGTSASDIAASGVKLYWTTTTSFATTNPLGTAQSLSGGIATFSGLNYNLPTGTSYVWVAFDIDAAAAVNNTVDAKIAVNGIDVAGTTYPVAEIDPVGTRTIKAALAGTYTVGTGGNYTSFTKTDGLFADINSLGLSGNVTINVISDITDETGATALNQWTETGAGNYTLTIQPSVATERIISSSSAAHLFNLNGADRVTFDGRYSGSGKYLRIRNTNTGYTTFRFTNSAQNNAIKYCYVEGANTSTTSGVIDFLATGNNNNNLIDNCIIRDRSDASAKPGNGIYFAGKANASSNIISNNEIFNFSANGVNLAYTTSTTVSGNQIYMTSASTQSTVTAIFVGDAPSSVITGNNIFDLNGSTTAAVKGIFYSGANSMANNVDIYNNVINLSPTTSGNVDGIDYYGYSANSCNIYFNSVRIGGSHTSGTNATYAFRKRDNVATMNIKNNVFVNARSNSGSTAKHYAIAFTTTTATSLSIDNNDYLTSGSGGVLGVYSSTDKITLAAWKASTTQDAASKSFNPGFTSATDLSLLVSNNLGTPISGITTDYSGVTRDLTNPDMGAYENNTTNALTFNGATDAWEVASNWTPNVVPNLSTNVTIPANKLAVVNSNNYECNNLTVAPKGELTINAGKDLLVNGTLMLQSDVTGTASLVENGTLLASSTTAQRYIAKDNSWHFLSSPVDAQTIIPNFAPTTCDQTFDFYKWDANADLTSPASTPWVNLRADATTYEPSFETNFAVGRGYLVAYSDTYGGNATHEFTGTLNSGDKSIAVVYDANNKFNLIGNPFASAIDWNSNGYTGRANVLSVDINNNSSIWIWNGGTTGQYGVFNNSAGGTNGVTNIIAPNQAFFVEAQTGGSFTIPNAARVHPGTQNFLKSTPVDLLKLKVTSTANTYSDEIIVNFNSNATANQGAAKWFSMIAQAPSLYSIKNNKNFSINTLTAINADLIVPVGFKAGVNGNYSIKASELASFSNLSNLILKDLQTGITQNLLQNPVYNFASSTADNANRFQLIFNSTSGINNLSNNSSVIYYADNQIQIQSNNQIERLEIYNSIGQLVYQSNTKSNQLSVNVSDFTRGTYIVRLIANQKIQTQKLIINN